MKKYLKLYFIFNKNDIFKNYCYYGNIYKMSQKIFMAQFINFKNR